LLLWLKMVQFLIIIELNDDGKMDWNQVIWNTSYQIVFNRMDLGNMLILYNTLGNVSCTIAFPSQF
jgi:hypothetical protein